MDLKIDRNELSQVCRRHHIRKLAIFGSALRNALRPDSDVDVLVDFEPEHVPGFFRLHTIAQELSKLFDGRTVDLVTEKFLNPRIRRQVVASAYWLLPSSC